MMRAFAAHSSQYFGLWKVEYSPAILLFPFMGGLIVGCGLSRAAAVSRRMVRSCKHCAARSRALAPLPGRSGAKIGLDGEGLRRPAKPQRHAEASEAQRQQRQQCRLQHRANLQREAVGVRARSLPRRPVQIQVRPAKRRVRLGPELRES